MTAFAIELDHKFGGLEYEPLVLSGSCVEDNETASALDGNCSNRVNMTGFSSGEIIRIVEQA